MRARFLPVPLGAACALLLLALASPAAAQAGTTLYLHRDGTLGADPPAQAEDAVLALGLANGHVARFETAPLAQDLVLPTLGTVLLTVGTEATVQGRLRLSLLADGQAFAVSSEEVTLIGLQTRDLAFAFAGLRGTLPAGHRLGLDLELDQLLPLEAAVGDVQPTNLLLEVRYDSVAHPGGLHLPPPPPGLRDPGTPTGPGGTGGTGGPGPTGTNTTGPEGDRLEPTLLGPGDVDPVVALLGVGTSATAVAGSLVLRGRKP